MERRSSSSNPVIQGSFDANDSVGFVDNVAQTPLIARAGEGHAAATLRFYTLIDF
jgi:hypothetical protein